MTLLKSSIFILHFKNNSRLKIHQHRFIECACATDKAQDIQDGQFNDVHKYATNIN